MWLHEVVPFAEVPGINQLNDMAIHAGNRLQEILDEHHEDRDASIAAGNVKILCGCSCNDKFRFYVATGS